ncbi:MAG: hypothetical protein EBQ71_18670 [Betaproteobacteria bacterium]|nr:hypothetical protein [Betaproteobacteria bacterium]
MGIKHHQPVRAERKQGVQLGCAVFDLRAGKAFFSDIKGQAAQHLAWANLVRLHFAPQAKPAEAAGLVAQANHHLRLGLKTLPPCLCKLCGQAPVCRVDQPQPNFCRQGAALPIKSRGPSAGADLQPKTQHQQV